MTVTSYLKTDLTAPAPLLWARRLGAMRRRRAAFLDTRAELRALEDRTLADLGVARCDIDRVARASVERKAA